MRKASLGTIFFTVFLDLLGFGLVVPYLPGVARAYGASDLVATLLGAVFSLMQFLFVPVWGHLSDRVGRRPLLVWSVAASAVGMLLLGFADSLWMLFFARIWSGIATSNLAVANAYIADITAPEDRSRGMGLIGAAIGLGFILGPVIGGLLEALSQTYELLPRVGALPAFAAAGLSAINLVLAVSFLPESLAKEDRGKHIRSPTPFDLERFRTALRFTGVAPAMAVNFVVILSFSGLEQTFRLFTDDAFKMSVRETGYVLGFVGIVLVVVQGGLMRRIARVVSERILVRTGVLIEAVGFVVIALSPSLGHAAIIALYAGMGIVALGSALTAPSLSAFVSKCSDGQHQGVVLGVLHSAGAFARIFGPVTGGLLYQTLGPRAPYVAGAIGMTIAGAVSLRLRRTANAEAEGGPVLTTREDDGRRPI
ncbi:MAG: MFS transporter [Polyangiaceae bacterium]|nr:MFS transporter [Polyangiaceae bacterium]NUQ76562.1 MFS transporter [Polyangiaceae bacterium]